MENGTANAVVIGGGSGIGEATCRLMRQRGWIVVVADSDRVAAAAVAARIDARSAVFDIGRKDEVERAADEIETTAGPVSALVVAAAVFQEVLPRRSCR